MAAADPAEGRRRIRRGCGDGRPRRHMHPFDRGWAAALPYATGVVELPEGFDSRLPTEAAPSGGYGVRPEFDEDLVWQLGLRFFNRVYPPEEFDVAVAAYANGIANLSPGTATTTKRQLYDDALHADAGRAVARSRELIGELMQAADYANSCRQRTTRKAFAPRSRNGRPGSHVRPPG